MEDRERTSIKAVLLILALWAAGLGAAGQFAKFAIPFASFQALYPGTGAELGFLVSLLSFVGFGLGLVGGVLVPRFGYKRGIVSMLFLGAVLSSLQAFLPPLLPMLALRVLEGVSHLVIVIVAPILISGLAGSRSRAFFMTLWGSFFGVAFSIIAFFGIDLIAWGGVSSLLWAHGGWMLVFAVLLFLFLPNGIVEEGRVQTKQVKVSLLKQHIRVYKSPVLGAPGLGWLFYTMTFVALLTVLPFFTEPTDREWVFATAPIASILFSLSAGVFLLRFTSGVGIVMIGFALSMIMISALWMTNGAPWLIIALYAAFGLVQGASFVAAPQLSNDPEDLAEAMGGMVQLGNLGNLIGTPLLLAVIGAFDFDGLILYALATLGLGLCVHAINVYRRGVSTQ